MMVISVLSQPPLQVTKEHRELVSRLNSDLRHLQEQVGVVVQYFTLS